MNNQPSIEVQKIQMKISEIKTQEVTIKKEELQENKQINKPNEPFTKMISRDQMLHLKMVYLFNYNALILPFFRKTK